MNGTLSTGKSESSVRLALRATHLVSKEEEEERSRGATVLCTCQDRNLKGVP